MRVLLTVAQGRGRPRPLEVEAHSVAEACALANAQGYTVLSKREFSLASGLPLRQERSALDVAVFIEQLRDLLVAGLSVIEALEALRRGASDGAAIVIERLQRQLGNGRSFSDALAADARFPALLVALVRASELTSDLTQSLSRFLEHEHRVGELRHRVASTAIYPMLLTGVGALVLGFLLFYVMPRFARVFEGMAGELPWSAQAMLAWSRLLAGQGLWVLLVLVAVLCALVAGGATTAGRGRLLRSVLASAPLRNRLRTYFLARWYRATGMLVSGGIPLSQALSLSIGLLPPGMQEGGWAVLKAVNEGLSPSAAHVRSGMATPVAEQLMLAGERTGDLGLVLTRVAQFHESEVSRSLERFMRALEPVVMVLIGVGVGVVVVLMYMPIFELAAAIS